MTDNPHTHHPHDAEEGSYMHWLDENGFPAMRQLLDDQRCEDVAVLRSVPTRDAFGTSTQSRLETPKPGCTTATPLKCEAGLSVEFAVAQVDGVVAAFGEVGVVGGDDQGGALGLAQVGE